MLELADVMASDQPVLATDGPSLQRRLLDGDLRHYDRILYMPMDETVNEDKPVTIEAARKAGFAVRELPVVHPRLYNAVLFERGVSTSGESAVEMTVPP